MTEDLLRKRLAERHQEDRPVNGMEADDVLADKVKVRRPPFVIFLRGVAVRVVADTRRVVCKRVEPHIDDMFRIEVDRNSP